MTAEKGEKTDSMQTIVIKVDRDEPDRALLERAAGIIKNGGLAAFPTETVYGLGANALDSAACEKIFEAKGRPQDNPLIVHIFDPAEADALCRDVSDGARALMRAFWPGPLTIIMKKREVVPDAVTCGLDTVAVRCPSHRVARALLEMSGLPIAAPSANRSGRPSTTSAAHVIEDMDGRIDCIIDGGECEVGLESTIIDMTGQRPRLLRPGGVTVEQLEKVIGGIELDQALFRTMRDDERPLCPGMKYRHYAPRAAVTMVKGEAGDACSLILRRIKQNPLQKSGVLCYNDYADMFAGAAVVKTVGKSGDKRAQARALFAALREFDATDVAHIYAVCPDSGGIGLAIENRLSKAAAFDIEQA